MQGRAGKGKGKADRNQYRLLLHIFRINFPFSAMYFNFADALEESIYILREEYNIVLLTLKKKICFLLSRKSCRKIPKCSGLFKPVR